jgi:nucleoside-diphosphate-sugar epimerase
MKKVLVTGGGGFVGLAIVKNAIARGLECVVVGRNTYPEVEKLGARCFCGDIRDLSFLQQACKGVDTVFHVAALAGIWGPWSDYYSINVQGTDNVIAACRKNDIPRLVYTSTPSVVFNRDHIEGGDERLPYPEKYLCNYARSKVMAEKSVLDANSKNLLTCALRPHLIWGPGDPHLIPRLLQKGRSGELKKIGSSTNLVDISYVDNVAHAHMLAALNLSGSAIAAGKAYFVSQGEPVNLWSWINELFIRVGIKPVEGKVSFAAAYTVGAVLESWHSLFCRKKEPRMTRFLAEQLAKSHYFSIAAIERDLGYSPCISNVDGMNNLVHWIEQNEATLF